MGLWMRMAVRGVVCIVALLMLWQGSAAQSHVTRHGRVRGDRHAFVDEGGPFLARGATLFWGLWGYQHDRERLGRNLATLRDWGIDYIRVLGVVGAPGDHPDDSWKDRRLDPTAASYDQDIAAFTDWAYGEYGLRVQWTIFGGTDFTPTPESRRVLVGRFGAMSQGRDEKIFAFEIANEAFQNGFPGDQGRRELHALARALKARSPILVALSAPPVSNCESARAFYRDSVADLMTLHLARAGSENGAFWNTFRSPWEFHTCTGVPMLAASNEPIGPESSVASMDDPDALSALAFVTYGSGIGAFVLHTGPGVRGGGAADRARARHSNLWELPTAARIARGLATIVRSVPGDFSNWTQQDGLSDASIDPPIDPLIFDVSDRTAVTGLYCFSKQPMYACAAFGIKRPLELVARRKVTASARALVTGASTPPLQLAPGGRFTIPASPPARVILGTFQ